MAHRTTLGDEIKMEQEIVYYTKKIKLFEIKRMELLKKLNRMKNPPVE